MAFDKFFVRLPSLKVTPLFMLANSAEGHFLSSCGHQAPAIIFCLSHENEQRLYSDLIALIFISLSISDVNRSFTYLSEIISSWPLPIYLTIRNFPFLNGLHK